MKVNHIILKQYLKTNQLNAIESFKQQINAKALRKFEKTLDLKK